MVAWLLLLWYGAGIIRPTEGGELADRIRDVLFLAILSSFGLAFFGLFYRPVCLAAAAALAAIQYLRTRASTYQPRTSHRDLIAYVFPVAATVTVAWPGLVRPLLEGDSLSYHLPNAAAWANAHSLWTTTTVYWWYPPGSELFASALFLIGGPKVLAVAGFSPLLMLALRIEAFARRAGLSAWTSGAVAAAATTVPLIGLQGASLQNDVWLGAWALECVWAITYDRAAFARSLAICAVIKPIGFVFGALIFTFAALNQRRRQIAPPSALKAQTDAIATTNFSKAARLTHVLRSALPCAMLVIWVTHVAVLSPNAIIPLKQTAYPHLVSTMILAHGAQGIATFTNALIHQGPGTLLLFMAVFIAAFAAKSVERRNLPWIFAAIFFVEPFGYDNGTPQLATGMSLRFLVPALVVGLTASLTCAKRWSTPIGLAAGALAISQSHSIISIFWNDSNTHGVLLVAMAFAILTCLKNKVPAPASVAAIVAIFVYGVHLDNDPIRYYDAALGTNVAPSKLYDWLLQNNPPRLIVSELGPGSISVVLPHAFVADATLAPCAEARRLGAMLVAAHRSNIRCGIKLFADDYASVYQTRR